jgi:uncharacterized protein (TIGR03437 family)
VASPYSAVLSTVLLAASLIAADGTRAAPTYSAASIANAASNQPDAYAPNTFISIYGDNLAWTERGLQPGDISGNRLPDVLPGTGVRVWVSNIPAHIYYVSKKQINALLPSILRPGPTKLEIQVDSTYGPTIPITIAAAAPAFFQLDVRTPIAIHGDGRVVTADLPAAPGEWIALFATGLGPTIPNPEYAEIPRAAAPLADRANFGILLNGAKVDPKRIPYAGVAPNFAGLYQINLQLPEDTGPDPEIRLSVGGMLSPENLHLPMH